MFDVGMYRFDVSCRTSPIAGVGRASSGRRLIYVKAPRRAGRHQHGAGCFGVPALPTIVHIVDDEPSVRKAISRLLRASGYDVAVYESAAELLQRLATKKASGCIVLDMMMPGISGLTVKDHL